MEFGSLNLETMGLAQSSCLGHVEENLQIISTGLEFDFSEVQLSNEAVVLDSSLFCLVFDVLPRAFAIFFFFLI